MPCKRAAMRHVDSVAHANHVVALPAVRGRVKALGFETNDLDACLAYIRDDAPIIVHFNAHTPNHLHKDPWYHSQFETGTSKGSLDHTVRKSWEDAMFSKAFASACKEERPKYCCLNIMGVHSRSQGRACMATFSSCWRRRCGFAPPLPICTHEVRRGEARWRPPAGTSTCSPISMTSSSNACKTSTFFELPTP